MLAFLTFVGMGLLWFFVSGGPQQCVQKWQDGKVAVEQEKTKQEQLRLERARVEQDHKHAGSESDSLTSGAVLLPDS
jgi:hypothetical protein